MRLSGAADTPSHFMLKAMSLLSLSVDAVGAEEGDAWCPRRISRWSSPSYKSIARPVLP